MWLYGVGGLIEENNMSNFLSGLRHTIRGVLLMVALVVSTISVFFTSGGEFWSDIAFCVWCIVIVQLTQLMDDWDTKAKK